MMRGFVRFAVNRLSRGNPEPEDSGLMMMGADLVVDTATRYFIGHHSRLR